MGLVGKLILIKQYDHIMFFFDKSFSKEHFHIFRTDLLSGKFD